MLQKHDNRESRSVKSAISSYTGQFCFMIRVTLLWFTGVFPPRTRLRTRSLWDPDIPVVGSSSTSERIRGRRSTSSVFWYAPFLAVFRLFRSETLDRETSRVSATGFTGNRPSEAMATARSVFLSGRSPLLPSESPPRGSSAPEGARVPGRGA